MKGGKVMSKTYAFSDLHGDEFLWNCISNYLKPGDIAYCLGDVCDRGPDGIKMMQEILKDKRIIYLKGNHEEMLLNAITTYNLDGYSGEIKTLQDYLSLPQDEQDELKKQLEELPIVTMWFHPNQITKVLLSHAGISCDNIYTWEQKKHFDNYLWGREHIKEDEWKNDIFPNVYIVHGHTPVQTIKPDQGAEVLITCNEHKYNIDLGTPTSKTAVLLDLETFEPIYFSHIDNN
jgi:hypothetical protein